MKLLRTCLLPLLLLAGCVAQAPPAPPPTAAAPDASASWYRKALQEGRPVYRIDAARSLVAVTVRRGGMLARLGHDHVVASRTLAGYIAPDSGRADFHFRLDQMTVDEQELRSQAGLDTQPSFEAIEGTRANMLGRVLEAERFPVVLLRAENSSKGAGHVRLSVTLHGITRSAEVPVTIERTKSSMAASGELRLRQTDFGITPMSVLNGAMKVEDTMEMRFHIVAAAMR